MRIHISILIAGALCVAGVSAARSESRSVAALQAKIVYVNIGQGDAVVMRIGGKVIVSDTGQYDCDVLDEALRDPDGLGATRIDVLILGHAHDDHSKNAAELLRKWDVGRVVMNESLWWDGTISNRAVKAAIRKEPHLVRSFPHAGQRFDWGGAEWIFVNPPRGEFLDANSRAAGNSSARLTCSGSTASPRSSPATSSKASRSGSPGSSTLS